MDWKKPELKEDGSVKIPHSWLYLHYYDALSVLFRVENALRMFVYVVLKAGRKGKWADLTLTSDDGGETTISAVAKRRLNQDEKFGYLGHRIASPLMHLTSGELIRVILAEAYWPLFAEYFPTTKEIVRTKLEEIGNIRNALAHFRPIKADDVEVVKQNANQVLSRVEEMLASINYLPQIVPTNTGEPWYASLKSVTSASVALSFQQSENERWVQVRLTHACSHAGAPYLTDTYRQWRVLTLISPNVLRAMPAVLDHVIYGFESLPFERFVEADEKPMFKKNLDLVFSRDALTQSHEAIRADLEQVLASIASETEFLLQDTLARGQLVRRAAVNASKSVPEGWSVNRSALRTGFRDGEPMEYWSRKAAWSADLITDTQRYPWMPVDVAAEDEVPF